MQRPELLEALQSVAGQTYKPIEVILVNASGQGEIALPEKISQLVIKQIGSTEQLSRPVAANAGLDNVSGDYVLFLDEDDWLAPEHLEGLVTELGKSKCLAAYSDTQKASAAGELLDEIFDHDFDLALLIRENFLPIHSVLFSRSLLDSGCRFDESLSIYEDWDFWLQVSQYTNFAHRRAVTAFYRDGGSSETAVSNPKHRYESGHPNALAREKVLQKWLSRWRGEDINRMLATLDQTEAIVELRENLDAAIEAKKIQRGEIESLQSNAKNLHDKLAERAAALDVARHDLESVRGQYHDTKKQFLEIKSQYLKTKDEYNSLTKKHEHLRVDRDDLANRHRQLVVDHSELQQHHFALQKGVEEILNSFSWRITRPYRFVANRLKKYFLAPIKRKLVQFLLRSPELHRRVKPNTQSKAIKNTVSSVQTDAIHFNIDSPSAENSLFSETLVLQGWALAISGSVDIVVHVDGLEYFHFSPSVSRPDVQRLFNNLPHAAACGFFERLSLRYLPSGEHKLRLTIKSVDGVVESFECPFLLYRSEELYNAWLRCQTDKFAKQAESESNELHNLQVIFAQSDDAESDVMSLESLVEQKHANFALQYVGNNWDAISAQLDEKSREYLTSRCTVSDTAPAAMAAMGANSGWVAVMSNSCVLAPYALQRMVKHARNTDADLIYSDHDSLHDSGIHADPVFTFAWSPEHLVSNNYIGDFYLLSSESLSKYASLLNSNYWPYRLLLQFGLDAGSVQRVAEIQWSLPQLNKKSMSKRHSEEISAIQEYLSDNKLPAQLRDEAESRSLDWHLHSESEPPRISIIIPTMGKLDLVRPCLDSLVRNSDYPDYEVIILDNSRGQNPEGIRWLGEQGFQIVECNESFNWARLNNRGAEVATGDLLLFLNDDIEIRQSDWLLELARQAVRPEIGAVGCKLHYPNGALQHAGVFLVNYGGGGLHLFHKMTADRHIYQRLDLRVREVSAVTGACLMVSRDKYDAVGGFDEELAVVGNDVDFCLRLLKRGQRNLWTPRCTLIHHESISRESSVPPEDERAMWRRWGEQFNAGDHYYNPNLSLTKWDCSQEYNLTPDELVTWLPAGDSHAEQDDGRRLQEGVNLIGYIRADMGLGEGARSDARALTAAEIDFGIINFESGNPSSMTNELWRHKEVLNAPYDINLIHINGDFLPTVVAELPAHFLAGRYNIAYWAWELEDLPEGWIPSLGLVDEIWVPSEFVKSAVEKVSTCPVVTIPHNVALIESDTYDRSYFGIPEERFAFLAMYDTRSIAERKNPRAALDAFKKAFSGDDNSVCLVLKLNNATDEAVKELNKLTKSHGNIIILDKRHSRQEVDALLSQIDCYVSLHRSEGFGLGPAEAMSLGKPCILTNWSGNTEYMTAENCMAVDYQLRTLEKDFGPYNAGQRWADADVGQAAKYMSALAGDPDLAHQLGQNAKASIEENFSPRAIGELIEKRLAEIRNLQHTGA